MKIKNISCTQFAGVRDCNVSFTDGINVIYGKNESGKSTIVNLLSRTLFQDARIDKRSDKSFIELYFPGEKKGGLTVGDFADGKITFETENGTYTLSKEWGTDARCSLSTPDGVIRDQGKIDDVLREVLLYGEGVYSDMLFSSQHNTDVSLQTILNASKSDTKQEITDAVSQAFAESDGISVDAIGEAIDEKIEDIAGKHWDFEREAPVRKRGRWANNLGEILKAYYALEDARETLDEISELEREADRAAEVYANQDETVRAAENAYNDFNTFASRLAVQSERKKSIEQMDKEIHKNTEILSDWPRRSDDLEKAKALQEEKKNREITDTWNSVNEIRAEASAEDLKTADMPCPDAVDFMAIRNKQRKITSLENKLCGMNLNADIQMLGGNAVKVTSLRSGEEIDVSDGSAAIAEAVRIEIPGVMEMQLAPADVDAASVEKQIVQLRESLADIFAQYKVESLEELEAYTQKIEKAKSKIENINARLDRVLGDMTPEQLEKLYKQAEHTNRTEEEIEDDIFAVCRSTDPAAFITKTETVMDSYAEEYGSIKELTAKTTALKAELKKKKDSIVDLKDIPRAYLSIADPESHLESLREDLKMKQDERESALTEKTSAFSRLDTYKEAHPEACAETVEKAERNFEEVLSLLHHWLHIAEVFEAQKETVEANPMEDIADRFTRYLSIISDGRVSSEFPDNDKLDIQIYSENNLLDYEKLSEGTKETVSLAFRLAVLDHLFPAGGGVIVFDDPFTDMDADRTEQACKLILECANRHQVIFMTCKEEYADMLGVRKIKL